MGAKDRGPAVPTVLIASDKFKGSLTAAEVAWAVGAGVRRALPQARVIAVPVADGGDGTLAAAEAAGFRPVPVTASGPTGEPVRTRYARRGDVAVVELADVSGLVRLPGDRLEPLRATSRGTGEVIAAAIAAGCRDIILGVGFAGLALLDAALRPGIELILDLVGFTKYLPDADLVVTGEGKLDEQTLHGKAPAGVARAARAAGLPVVAVCGTNTLPAQRLRDAGVDHAYALTDLEPDLDVCLRDGTPLLTILGGRIATEHLGGV